MNKPFYTLNEYNVAPGAKERIEKRLKDIPEINKNRPCKKCVYFNSNSIITCRSSYKCNFNHDRFQDSGRN